MSRYEGPTEGNSSLSAGEPFVVMGLPGKSDIRQFNTEKAAREFISGTGKRKNMATFARLYGFNKDRWERLAI